MHVLSVVPKLCTAITKAGRPCKKYAIAGESHCRIHHKPSPSDAPSLAKGFAKEAAKIGAQELLKFGLKELFEYILSLQRRGIIQELPAFLNEGPEFARENVEEWFAALDPETQQTILEHHRRRAAHIKTMEAEA